MPYRTISLLLLAFLWAAPSVAKEAEPASVPLYNDLGKHHRQISTRSPQAQRYFDQGLRLTYAFNHEEAIVSFMEGIRIDPDCAMCYWGAALAMGPNINLPMEPKSEPTAHELAQKAVALAPKVSEHERDSIDALSKRYAAEPPVRQNLGAVLPAKRPAEAEQVYREDLKRNPNNGWSFYGLMKSLKVQEKKKEAASAKKQFEKAWQRADIKPTASRF